MLYRVCAGSSSPRLRYRMTHQKIRPQTNTPTTRAAITEPTHRLYICLDWSVTPLIGQPKWTAWSTPQPDNRATAATATAAAPATRALVPPRTTCSASLAALYPRVRRLLDHAGPTRRGVGRLGVVAGYAYFDAAAGAPPHPVATQALQAAQADGWGDPTKLYSPSRPARRLLDPPRAPAAQTAGGRPGQ